MAKIVFFAILCIALVVPPAFAGNDTVGYSLELDASLQDYVAAAWLGYLMSRQIYIREHTDRYTLTPGIIMPTFDEEVAGRKDLVQIWKELKEKDQSRKDTYLDALVPVHEADFMREYVWTYLRQRPWSKQPADLRLKDFTAWKQKHLKGHRGETHGTIKITQ